jgi:hypothetical protein
VLRTDYRPKVRKSASSALSASPPVPSPEALEVQKKGPPATLSRSMGEFSTVISNALFRN